MSCFLFITDGIDVYPTQPCRTKTGDSPDQIPHRKKILSMKILKYLPEKKSDFIISRSPAAGCR